MPTKRLASAFAVCLASSGSLALRLYDGGNHTTDDEAGKFMLGPLTSWEGPSGSLWQSAYGSTRFILDE